MAKKTSPNQSCEIPVESVQTLQRQFEAVAQRDPGPMHVLVLNREGIEALVPESYTTKALNSDRAVISHIDQALWCDTACERFKPGWRLLHWLAVPANQRSNGVSAKQTLDALSQFGAGVLLNLRETLQLSDYIISPSRRDIERWLLALHEVLRPERHYLTPMDKTELSTDSFYQLLPAVYISSIQFCSWLLDLAEKQTKGQAKLWEIPPTNLNKVAKVVGKNHKARKMKTPPQLLKETRERYIAEELLKIPQPTSIELAAKLDCNKSTICRSGAWKNRRVFSTQLPEGIIVHGKDDSYSVDAVEETEPED